MHIRYLTKLHGFIRSRFGSVVAVWMLGLILGTLFSAGMDLSTLSWMRRCFSSSVSIVVLLIFAVLPFLISAYAVLIDRFEIVLAVLFCKGFLYAFFAFSAYLIFGSAGWLIQPMAQFSDLILMPMLIWFSACDKKNLMQDHLICIGTAVSAVLIHSFVVLPFLAELIEN